MLVVPLEKDVIQTDDGQKYKVVEYTNYKANGPAVYARLFNSKDVILVYFFDIISINDTKVEYQHSSKVLKAFGRIHREQHLPQPDDTIIVIDTESEHNTTKAITVQGIKLKSKSLGVNRGMLIKANDNYYRLKDILDIKTHLGNSFDKQKFDTIYKDYSGV